MSPIFFTKQSDFRKWLVKNHQKENELLVGFYKVGSGSLNMTWSQSVDAALCFGWIDGVRTSIDKDRYQIRFTKRKPGSVWSAVNIRKVKTLTEQGLMLPAGVTCFKNRNKRKSTYTHENEELELPSQLLSQFKANKKAWKYFQALAPSYRKISTNWIMNAKQETTRVRRFNIIVTDSEKGTNMWKDNKYKKKVPG